MLTCNATEEKGRDILYSDSINITFNIKMLTFVEITPLSISFECITYLQRLFSYVNSLANFFANFSSVTKAFVFFCALCG